MSNKGLAGRCAAVILSAAMWMSGAGAAGVMAGEADYDIFVSGETMETEAFDQGSAFTEEFSETPEQEMQAEEDFLPDIQVADPEETPAEVSQEAMTENPEEEESEAAAVVSAPETVDPVAEFSGSESVGDALFTGGDEAADFVGEESATATPAAGAVEVKAGDYVLMNIPYAKFYEAEIGQADAVDAVSSSTLNKPRTGGLAGGSYHVDPAGTDISGVIYPVMVEDPAALAGYTQVTDESSVTITVTNRGQEATTTYTGSEALFESPDYSYYVLSESPVRYKVMHADGSFDAVNGEVKTVEGVTGEVTVGARHADVEIALTGTTGIETGARVSGIVLTTEDGGKYALRHIANIWRGTEIGWNLSDMDLGGKTITNIRYYTLTDVIDYPVSLSISKAAYVLMNIPYAKFYEAEIGQADAVDAVSSSTLNKPRTGGLAGGSYHVDPTGTDISGVIYPVMVKDVAMLANYKQVTDEDSVTITVTNRGQEATTTYTGSEALFESPDYSYYLLSEKPARFKVLNEDGTFSAVGGRAATVEGVTGTVKVGARHADIEIALTGTEGIAQGDQVSGIIVTTNDGVIYPLSHIANIWRATEIGWNESDFAIQGKTITNIRYITRSAVIDYPTQICVHKLEKVEAVEATYEAAGNIEYYRCTSCGKIFADANAAEELTAEAVVVPMLVKVPEKVANLSTTVYVKRKQIRVSFDQAAEAQEYQIIYRKAGDEKWTRVKIGSQTTYTLDNMEENSLYLIRVRGVKTVDGKKYYGPYSSVSRRWTDTPAVSFKANKKSATLTLGPVDNAIRYQVRYALSKDMKDAKIVYVNGNKSSYKLKGLESGTRYYIRVRAYVSGPDGKKYNGALTSVRSIKTR